MERGGGREGEDRRGFICNVICTHIHTHTHTQTHRHMYVYLAALVLLCCWRIWPVKLGGEEETHLKVCLCVCVCVCVCM